MCWIDWTIFCLPLIAILLLALYSGKYVRGVADYLVAGRVAGRYVISVGDLQSGLGVITLVAICEQQYQCGIAVGFWGNTAVPIAIFMSLTGYVLYRYRETRSLSIGQFLETRYNRSLRVVASSIRTLAEMMTNAIGPAVAARFFIYFLGLPAMVNFGGMKISTYAIVIILVLLLALLVIWPGGRVSLLVTDAVQGVISYPVFVILTCFILSEISWNIDVAPVLQDRVTGESFLNPLDIQELRDFNLFALIVTLIGSVLNRGAWIGNDTSAAGRTAHEQKMAGILGAWRNGFSMLALMMLSLFMITIMHASRFSDKAEQIRKDLTEQVANELITDPSLRKRVIMNADELITPQHEIGVSKPYSRKNNPDLQYLDTVRNTISTNVEDQIISSNIPECSAKSEQMRGAANELFQKFRTLYYQMMSPVLLKRNLPIGLMGLFLLLMAMLMLATDDSRIFNASATLVQDVVMPFRKKPFQKKEHLYWLRGMSVVVCLFFFIVSIFFAQMDYINMFINAICSLWLGAAGPIMLGGLYTKWGTSTGAFCALFFGSGTALGGIFCQRLWAKKIYPFLHYTGGLDLVSAVCSFVTNLCDPIVVWEVSPDKFPINSFEIYFLSMLIGCLGYTIGSLLTYRTPYDLNRMLHRGKNVDKPLENRTSWTWKNVYTLFIGITPEYSKGDKIIAWSVFFYSIVWQFLITFVGVVIWNIFKPWPTEWWSKYFLITVVVVGIIVGVVSTVWFIWGGIVDIRRLFIDLSKRKDNPLDDGWVEKNVSIVDKPERE